MEVIVAAGIVVLSLSGVLATSSHCLGVLQAAKEAAAASQVLQERMEQLRAASWTEITSDYPPDSGGFLDGFDDDPTIPDDLYEAFTTEFPAELPNLGGNLPGLAQLMALRVPSISSLLGVVGLSAVAERITVTPYPQRAVAPIQVARDATGNVIVVSHNENMVMEKMVRVDVRFTWRDRKGVLRMRETSTLVTPSPRQ